VHTAAGLQRLCQKCNRLHPLAAFTGEKCCCDAKLAALRQRRSANAAAVAASVSGTTVPPVDDTPLAWLEEFLEHVQPDPASPAVVEAGAAGAGGSVALGQGPATTDWPWELPHHATAVLKLAGSPVSAFAPPGVRAQLLPLGILAPGSTEHLQAAVRPGCTLLSLDALVLSEPGGFMAGTWLAPGDDGAASALTQLLADSPCLAAQARLPGGLQLTLPDSTATARAAPLRHWWSGLTSPSTSIATSVPGPAELRVAPLAALSTVPVELLLHAPSALITAEARVWLRINGQYIAAKPAPAVHAAAALGELRVMLPPTNTNGCAMVELDLGDGAGISCAALLLTTDAAVAVELAAHAPSQDCDFAVSSELNRAVWAVGCSLALAERHVARNTTPSAHYAIAAASAAAAIRFGWLHSLHACIAVAAAAESAIDPADLDATTKAPFRAGNGACLLHQAVASRSPVLLQATLRAPRVLRGTALTPDASGSTPLHAAARTGILNLIEQLCATDGNDSLSIEGADAVLGFFTLRDSSGATPYELCNAVHGVGLLRSRFKAGAALARAAAAAVPVDRGIVRIEHAAALSVDKLVLLAPEGSDTSRIAKALLMQASAAARTRDAASCPGFQEAPAPASSLHALRATLSLLLLYRVVCALMSSRRPFSDADIYAARPALTWEHWQSMPTVMCCRSVDGVLDVQSAQAVLTGLIFMFAFLPGSAARLRGGRISLLHSLVVAWVLIIDPCVCALRTYARYGAGLRQPWQGGLRQLVVLASIHVSTDTRLPKAAYFTILAIRCIAPLITRMLEDVIQLRVLIASLAWDGMHAALVFACMVHYVKVQSVRVLRAAAREHGFKEKAL